MPSLEEYRAWTDQNLLLARAAQTEGERLFYLDLARAYLHEIVRLDRAKDLPPAGTLSGCDLKTPSLCYRQDSSSPMEQKEPQALR